MEKLKLSGLKRSYIFRIELGPYVGTERRRYATWWAELPGSRIVFALQRDKTILARKIVEGADYIDPMDLHKWATIFTGNALYHEIRRELELVSRPMVKTCSVWAAMLRVQDADDLDPVTLRLAAMGPRSLG